MSEHKLVKFLLVDDQDANLLALEALLKRDGLECLKAQSGRDALELLLIHEISLALVDVQMPDMDGFELAELMRGMERTKRVPIMFLTAVATEERRRFRGYEMGAVDYLLKPIDSLLLKSKADVFFQLADQRLELAEHRDELRATADRLNVALAHIEAHRDNSPLAIVQFDADLRVIGWSKGAERILGWSAAEVIGRDVGELICVDEKEAAEFKRVYDDMYAGRKPRSVDSHRNRRRDGGIRDCEWYSSLVAEPSTGLYTFAAQVLDVTERKQAEETQSLLIGELNHRVKNMLAMIQAIATQTLKHSPTPSAFANNFSGRLQSLAKAHTLLSSATWKGTFLGDLIRDQLSIGAFDTQRLQTSGPEVGLPPQVALHFGLMLHELATNAIKYGAFSTAEGRLSIGWTLERNTLHFKWVESCARSVKAPTGRGFGSLLLDTSSRSTGGSATVVYRSDGVDWTISVPLPQGMTESMSLPERTVPMVHRVDPASGATAVGGLANRHFLIVEDEPLVALELSALLEESSARVSRAGTIEQALQMIAMEKYDGALLDGNLQGKSVDAVAAALTNREIPFIFVSGYGREHLPHGFQQGRLISKPFSRSEMLEALGGLLMDTPGVIRMKR